MRRVSNEDVVTAVFSASPDAKSHALDILLGRVPPCTEQSFKQDYMTTQEACDFLRCSRMTLFRLERDGVIESVHLRGKKLFERVELIKALKSGKGRK